MNKLAEEILIANKIQFERLKEEKPMLAYNIIEAMQAYHEAKLAEITDEDIEAWADGLADAGSLNDFERGEWLGIKEGAKSFRDGKITPANPR